MTSGAIRDSSRSANIVQKTIGVAAQGKVLRQGLFLFGCIGVFLIAIVYIQVSEYSSQMAASEVVQKNHHTHSKETNLGLNKALDDTVGSTSAAILTQDSTVPDDDQLGPTELDNDQLVSTEVDDKQASPEDTSAEDTLDVTFNYVNITIPTSTNSTADENNNHLDNTLDVTFSSVNITIPTNTNSTTDGDDDDSEDEASALEEVKEVKKESAESPEERLQDQNNQMAVKSNAQDVEIKVESDMDADDDNDDVKVDPNDSDDSKDDNSDDTDDEEDEAKPSYKYHEPGTVICTSQETGKWISKKSGKKITNTWCPISCKYSTFAGKTARKLLANTKIHFIGNSHVRNLFRCTTDIATGGGAYKSQPSSECKDPKDWSPTSFCYSCTNMGKAHGLDFSFDDAAFGVSTKFYWSPFWSPRSVLLRDKCVSGEKAASPKEIQCIMNTGQYSAFAKGYVGNHFGLDIVRYELASVFRKDPDSYLVFNYFRALNTLDRLKELLIAMKKIVHEESGLTMKDRAVFIMDPMEGGAVAMELRGMFDKYGVTYIDMTAAWAQYANAKIPSASNGAMFVHNHLGPPGNTVLASQLLSLIAEKQIAAHPWLWKSTTLPSQIHCDK